MMVFVLICNLTSALLPSDIEFWFAVVCGDVSRNGISGGFGGVELEFWSLQCKSWVLLTFSI